MNTLLTALKNSIYFMLKSNVFKCRLKRGRVASLWFTSGIVIFKYNKVIQENTILFLNLWLLLCSNFQEKFVVC